MPAYFLTMKPDMNGSYEIHEMHCAGLPKPESRVDLDVQISGRDALDYAKLRFYDKRDNIKLCIHCCQPESEPR